MTLQSHGKENGILHKYLTERNLSELPVTRTEL